MEPIELRSSWPAATVLGAPPVRFGCPLHAGELLPCRRCAAWLATRRLELVVTPGGVPVALIDHGPRCPPPPAIPNNPLRNVIFHRCGWPGAAPAWTRPSARGPDPVDPGTQAAGSNPDPSDLCL